MAERWIDRIPMRRRFDRVAKEYAQHDDLASEAATLLAERLDVYTSVPERVVDLGAGTGRDAADLKRRWPKAQTLALDQSLPMLREARRRSRWLRPIESLCADAGVLPLVDACVDVLHANLCFQWIDDLPALFGECARVLKPDGLLAFTTLGPDTLKELRAAWAAVDDGAHVGRFLDMHDVGDAMLAAGLRDPVLDVERGNATYSDPRKLLQELRGLGATNVDRTRARHLTGQARYRAMLAAYEGQRMDGRVPATWELVVAHAWGPQPGQSLRGGSGGETATFPIDKLRGSRR